ncbi:SMI1/KNR4 family protein [Ottowia thiooxydans]|uniref:SMI1/KNR4 family protein n=1 Tax=Ottowia thiooxydans TaxID=219182 RepID=UPI00048CA06A|nr:SMI1/KNR4 family protein [Ottowia thiooxydans]
MSRKLNYSSSAHDRAYFSPASEEKIKIFCSDFDIVLPKDYFGFLKKYNGGSFIESHLPKTTLGELTVSRFYTLTDSENYSITNSIGNLEGYVPIKFIPIADDPGGNLYLLALDEKHYSEVYFWNHEAPLFSQDGDFDEFENLTKLFNSFEEFIESLEKSI